MKRLTDCHASDPITTQPRFSVGRDPLLHDGLRTLIDTRSALWRRRLAFPPDWQSDNSGLFLGHY